jgi:hypothetical protein
MEIITAATMAADAEKFRAIEQGQALVIRDQIGFRTVLGISGGRWRRLATGITLPVSAGYSVEVHVAADDTYTIRRVFKRGAKQWVKGEWAGIYCDMLSEMAWQASRYANVAFGDIIRHDPNA